MHTRAHTYEQTQARKPAHACTKACMHARTHARTHRDVGPHMHARACTHTYEHMHARNVRMHSDENPESTEALMGWPRLMHAILLAPEAGRPTKRRRM